MVKDGGCVVVVVVDDGGVVVVVVVVVVEEEDSDYSNDTFLPLSSFYCSDGDYAIFIVPTIISYPSLFMKYDASLPLYALNHIVPINWFPASIRSTLSAL